MKRKLFAVLGTVVALSLALAGCASPTPQTIVETVQVPVTSQVEVTRVVAGTPQTIEVTAPPATAVPMQFEGVTVNLLTFEGPQVAEPLIRRAPDFKALT